MAWRRLMSFQNSAFTRYLLVTNTVVTISLEGLSDCTQQLIEGQETNDWARTRRMMVMGAFFGPVEHFWYRFLDSRLPGVSRTVVLKKVVLDEAVFGVSSILVFFFGMALMEGRGRKESWEHTKSLLWPTYKVSLLIWPIAQMINFYYLPNAYRVVFLNFVNYVWCIFLSYAQHKKPNAKYPQD